jgi:hypothetical protein
VDILIEFEDGRVIAVDLRRMGALARLVVLVGQLCVPYGAVTVTVR